MHIQSTSSNDATQKPVSRDEISSLIENKVAETLKRTLPDILRNAFIAPDPNCSPNMIYEEQPLPKKSKADDDTPSIPVCSRTEKYYATVQEATISE